MHHSYPITLIQGSIRYSPSRRRFMYCDTCNIVSCHFEKYPRRFVTAWFISLKSAQSPPLSGWSCSARRANVAWTLQGVTVVCLYRLSVIRAVRTFITSSLLRWAGGEDGGGGGWLSRWLLHDGGTPWRGGTVSGGGKGYHSMRDKCLWSFVVFSHKFTPWKKRNTLANTFCSQDARIAIY